MFRKYIIMTMPQHRCLTLLSSREVVKQVAHLVLTGQTQNHHYL